MFTGSVLARIIACVALVGGIAAGAHAGSLTVTPLLVKLDDSTRSAALTVSNRADEARVIQVELVRWTQKNGVDVQTPTDDLLVNPPLATLQPGQSQTVRIGLKRRADSARELAYRLYFTEVPPPSDHVNGLRVVMQLGVPVYVAPRAKASARVNWRATHTGRGEVLLTLANDGNRHLRVDSFKAIDAHSGRLLGASPPGPFALLAGQARRFRLKFPPGWYGGQVKLITQTGDGTSEARIDVPRRSRQAAPTVQHATRTVH